MFSILLIIGPLRYAFALLELPCLADVLVRRQYISCRQVERDVSHPSHSCTRDMTTLFVLEVFGNFPWGGEPIFHFNSCVMTRHPPGTLVFSALRAYGLSRNMPLAMFIFILSLVPIGINMVSIDPRSLACSPTFLTSCCVVLFQVRTRRFRRSHCELRWLQFDTYASVAQVRDTLSFSPIAE